MSKKPKKKTRRPERNRKASTASSYSVELGEAQKCLSRGDWNKARDILEAFVKRHPQHHEAIQLLAGVYFNLNDSKRLESTCYRLASLSPGDPDATLMLATSHSMQGHLMLAWRTLQRFLDRWPTNPHAPEVRRRMSDLESGLDDFMIDVGLTGEQKREFATWNEEMQVLMNRGDYAGVRKVAGKLLQLRPRYAPALNNTSEAWFIEGLCEQAIASAQRVLGFDPANYFALSNLTRYCLVTGRLAEAKIWAEQLKEVVSDGADIWVKKAEALSYLGDDRGVLDALRLSKDCKQPSRNEYAALLSHLAAVAAYRLGREAEARGHWQESRKLYAGLDLARENMMDLNQPVEKRHAPWPFDIGNWIREKTIDDLQAHLAQPVQSKDNGGTQTVRAFLLEHPEVGALIPILLDRGDPDGRKLALRIAMCAETPELLAAVKDFALSRRGPDSLRMQAAEVAMKHGLLPGGIARMWTHGKWEDVLLMTFEISPEPIITHSPQVTELIVQAHDYLTSGDGKAAEVLLRKALAIEPESPDILNNLGMAFEFQGRFAERTALMMAICQRFPDYLFIRVGMARMHIIKKEFDKAKAQLDPLMSRRRFHTSEFGALALVQIEFWLVQEKRKFARIWFDLWQRCDSENPQLACLRPLLRESSNSEY